MAILTVVDPHWVFKNAQRDDVIIADTRRLIDYKQGHLPGSISMPFTSFVKMKGLSNDLPDAKTIESLLSGKGVSMNDLVVAYDDYAGRHSSRLLYTLEVYGHEKLGILDRPFSTYAEEGLPVAREETLREPARYNPVLRENILATKASILSVLQNRRDDQILLDTRPTDDYKFGHIPTAINLPWYLFGDANRTFRPLNEIRSLLKENGIFTDREIITYCDEGTSSVYVSYTLRLSGYRRVLNYPLSYGEWGADPSLPKERSLG